MEITTNKSNTNLTYTLSIQVSLNGLSFCVRTEDQKIITIEHEDFGIWLSPEQTLKKIKNLFNHHSHLSYDFKKVDVTYQNDLYCLVPQTLFDKNALKSYLQYSVKVLETDYIAYDELSSHQINVVYIPYANINNYFFETFGEFTYKHNCSVLIENLAIREKNQDTPQVYVQLHTKSFDLLVTKKGKVILANTYPIESKEDFLYYLLFATEQLDLNPELFPLYLFGHINEGDDFFELTKTYIRNVKLLDTKDLQKTDTDNSIPDYHQNFTVLSQF